MNDQPTPTEKSQIVIYWTYQAPSLVTRFNSVKKGEKEYVALNKAWGKWCNDVQHDHALHGIAGDMFITTIDLSQIAAINFIDHVKREKFVPIP